jgi:hypothetical protein
VTSTRPLPTTGSFEKYRYGLTRRDLLRHPVAENATGLAFYGHPFAEGVERQVYRCAEINVPPYAVNEWIYGRAKMAVRLPRRLVSKEAKHDVNLGRKFQQQHAQVQTEAEELPVLTGTPLPSPVLETLAGSDRSLGSRLYLPPPATPSQPASPPYLHRSLLAGSN